MREEEGDETEEMEIEILALKRDSFTLDHDFLLSKCTIRSPTFPEVQMIWADDPSREQSIFDMKSIMFKDVDKLN